MKSDFETLLAFLERMGPEVQGRHSPEPQPEAAKLLDRMAVGKCSDEERDEACKLLQKHPAWIRYVARQARLSRSPEESVGVVSPA